MALSLVKNIKKFKKFKKFKKLKMEFDGDLYFCKIFS